MIALNLMYNDHVIPVANGSNMQTRTAYKGTSGCQNLSEDFSSELYRLFPGVCNRPSQKLGKGDRFRDYYMEECVITMHVVITRGTVPMFGAIFKGSTL